ncbi:unnamed protein product [Microthlaspi erraticum]|uniref:F-box domain-containing protein n=1 Tax=Microthlaspi erraticum TaxID=1685480 RepID=A0A6D2IFY4_9BRAS|nr:unnamed protein product [Microthlaspi erraticum]
MRISNLSDDLLIKILSFLPTKVAVSTSILSKQWRFLWMWLPTLEYNDNEISVIAPLSASWLRYEEFINKNLPLHRAPIIETFLISFVRNRITHPEKLKLWVEIAVSRSVRELSVGYFSHSEEFFLSLPISLYACDSLMALKLQGKNVLVDVVPLTVSLPMPKLEEAEFRVSQVNEKVLESVTFVKRLSLSSLESVYPSVGIVMSQLEHLELRVYKNDWSKLLIWLLRNSPKLRVLNLYVGFYRRDDEEYEPVDLKNEEESSVPECLLRSLETFEFSSHMGTQEERCFLSFFFTHASCLKSASVIHRAPRHGLQSI